uniref:Trimeric autotransporter adhesin YadA-like head domain-containing protein n=2 Tax=Corethron hystrix TaxID=216773 RepID=A0A7S1G0Q5_9STRA|mmetsp:Transcript_5111/g.10306  ORF Transcript_5111/g.10306 Transcript_5111/m.10306 type:complete len:111 (+) Transcript_5111:506-838(+)
MAQNVDASVSGGYGNKAVGKYASVLGGRVNFANGDTSTISGGIGNKVEGKYSSISGGMKNIALGVSTSIVGGKGKIAEKNYSFRKDKKSKKRDSTLTTEFNATAASADSN